MRPGIQGLKRWPLMPWLLGLGGCFPIAPVQIYLPTDVASEMLGGCPSIYRTRLPDADGVALTLLVRPPKEGSTPFSGEFWIDPPRGRSATFVKAAGMSIRGVGSSESVVPYLYCPSPYGLTGPPYTRCHFEINLVDAEVIVQFPPVEVEGSRLDIPPMRFALQTRPAVCSLSA